MEPWEHILTVLKCKGDCDFVISAAQMKECGKSWKGAANQFEPRLLAYQTTAESRPSIFKKYGLCILPIKNGEYLLTKQNIYMPLDYTTESTISVVRDKSSDILQLGDSETSLIDNLRYSGVFERPEILGEPITHGPLLNGRHRINMEMNLGGKSINIKGAQYETDSCFETKNKILIIEGKSCTTQIDSFNIRQLYFPFREVTRITSGKKNILCLFIHKLKGAIHIWKYNFTDVNSMDSIVITGHSVYNYQ